MPVGSYFKGHGENVMAQMKSRYGDKRGERVFYATANSRKLKHSKRRSQMKRAFSPPKRAMHRAQG